MDELTPGVGEGGATVCRVCKRLTLTNADGTCPSCWAHKSGPRYVLDYSQVVTPRKALRGVVVFSVVFGVLLVLFVWVPWFAAFAGVVVILVLALVVLWLVMRLEWEFLWRV